MSAPAFLRPRLIYSHSLRIRRTCRATTIVTLRLQNSLAFALSSSIFEKEESLATPCMSRIESHSLASFTDHQMPFRAMTDEDASDTTEDLQALAMP